MLVVDASVAVEAALSQTGFVELAPEELVAPPLLWSEVPSALHELRWREAVREATADQALARFLDSDVAVRRPRRLTEEAWRVANQLGWAKTYDAEYVALARLLRCRLVTIDGRVQRGAQRAVAVVGPREL